MIAPDFGKLATFFLLLILVALLVGFVLGIILVKLF